MRRFKILCAAFGVVALLSSCKGTDGNSCTVTNNGDGSSTISCTDGTSSTVRNGAPGQGGSCTVTDNGNGTRTIACTDGTSVTVTDGTQGPRGTSCTVSEVDAGVKLISCADGTSVIVTDGAAGPPGDAGTSCSVSEVDAGVKLISCTDGTSVTVTDGATGPAVLPPPSAETCELCHGTGAVSDQVALHAARRDDRLQTGSLAITDVSFPAAPPVRPVVLFRLLDQQGNVLPGMTTVRLALVKLVPGANGDGDRWVPYKFSSGGQPTYERGRTVLPFPPGTGEGLLEDLGGGNYRYTWAFDFSTAVGWNPASVHRLFVQNDSSNNPAGHGTFKANGVTDLTPGAPSTLLGDVRPVVTTQACNQCHGLLNMHGRRYEVGGCVTCHNASLMGANFKPEDLTTIVHKLHAGASLPSVVDGGTYTIATYDFSDVVYPRRLADCTVCHQGGVDTWRTRPTKEACGTCHEDVWFGATTSTPAGMRNHTGFPQTDNQNCAFSSCHGTTATFSVENVHADRVAAEAAKYVVWLDGPTNTAPGQTPQVVFQVYNPTGTPAAYDLSAVTGPWAQTGGNSRLWLSFAWTNTVFLNEGAGTTAGQPAGLSVLTASNRTVVTCPASAPVPTGPCYRVTSPVPVPASTTGSGTVAVDGHPAVTLPGNTALTWIPLMNSTRVFAITDTFPRARTAQVDIARCNNCHGNLSAHNANRQGRVEVCAMCHNPNATDRLRRPATGAVDGKAEVAIDFRTFVHTVHSASTVRNKLTVYGFGSVSKTWSSLRYPNVAFNCTACHVADAVTAIPLSSGNVGTTKGSGANVIDPTDNLRGSAQTAVCVSCHDTGLATGHMQQMGGVLEGLTQAELDALQ